jgi:putative peptide zinc metalloprotease protein
VHPPTGTQVVAAGGSQSAVFVVVEGALAGRKPGDPPGTIRHHVGPGGVVGLVNALTGRSTQLDWHTSGTSLLSLPAATVATVVGPLPGPPPQDRAEAESLFADTPALAGLAVDQRLALIASAHPVDLDPGAPVILPGPTHAIVVESGVIALPDGIELRRGTLVGPVGDGSPGMVAQTVTPARLWVLPDASDLPPLVGATHRPGSPMPVVAVSGGLRPSTPGGGGYPPLTVPPGPPEGLEDPEVDRRFERRLWWLVVFLLTFALALTGLNFRAGPAWAEMPDDDALLTVDKGRITALLDGDRVPLEEGDRRYVSEGAQIEVPDQAAARLTFPGGAITLICAGTRIQVGALATRAGRDQSPTGRLSLQSGRLLADTRTASGAYEPLALTVARDAGTVTNNGAAWFAVEQSALTVSTGSVLVDGTASPTSEAQLGCSDGVPVEPPVESSADPQIDEEPIPTAPASAPPSIIPSASVSPSATVGSPIETPDPVETDDDDPTVRPTRTVTTRPATTRPPAPTTTPPRTTPATTPPPTTAQPTPDPTTEPPPQPPAEGSSSSG